MLRLNGKWVDVPYTEKNLQAQDIDNLLTLCKRHNLSVKRALIQLLLNKPK